MKNANPLSPALSRRRDAALHRLPATLALACALLFAACDQNPSAPAGVSSSAEHKTILDVFPVKVGAETVRMQLAVTDAEMEHGLMQRRDLAPDEGMLFVYPKPQAMSFWMKNTPTALDIGYFTADGVLREVYPMYPYDETNIPSQSNQIQFCLEMNLSWFKNQNLKPGAQLDLAALTAALRDRGYDPTKFGLK